MRGAPGFNKCKKMFIWLELPKAKNSNPQSDQWLKLQSTSDSASGPPLLKEAIAGSRMEARKVAEEEEEARQKLLFVSVLFIISAVALPITVWKSGMTCSLHWCDLGFFPGKRGCGSQFILSSSLELLYKSWGIGKSMKKQSAVFLPCLGGYF